MTDRSIWQRLASAYLKARDFYRELRMDIDTLRNQCRRALWLGCGLIVVAFGAGVWIA